MEHTKIIAMQTDLGLGHKGEIILTTRERVDKNLPMIARDILNKQYAEHFVYRWNAFEEDGLVENLVGACKRAHGRLLEMGQRESHRTVQILTAAIAEAKPVGT